MKLTFHPSPKSIWLVGLTGSGKTTLGSRLQERLWDMGYANRFLDGDDMRSGLNVDLSFTMKDRRENIRRIAEVNKLFLDSGLITINAFVSPTADMRELARGTIGSERFIGVFLDCPLEICEERDTKGMYKKAREGQIKHLAGVDDVFEPFSDSDIHIKTMDTPVDQAAEMILKQLG